MSLPTTQIQKWEREQHLISTDTSLIPPDTLNDALGSDRMHWATRLSAEELHVMVNSSVCFGLYDMTRETPAFFGFARLVTDRVTFVYLTDVWISEEREGQGLGSWLIECVREWTEQMPNMRQLTLITGAGKKEEYYAKKLGTTRFEDIKPGLQAKCFVKPGPAGCFR